jgi:hypothetical protein
LSRVPREPTQKIRFAHLPAFKRDLDPVHLRIGRENPAERGSGRDWRDCLERVSAERPHGEAGGVATRNCGALDARRANETPNNLAKAAANPRVDFDGIAARGCERCSKSSDGFVVGAASSHDERGPPARERGSRPLNRRVDLGLPAPVVETCFGGETNEVEAIRLRPIDLRSGDRRDRTRNSDDLRLLGGRVLSYRDWKPPLGAPMRDERIFNALRPDGE